MLNIMGPTSRYCDGVTRRNFLKIGAFAFGATAFTLADLLSRRGRPGTLVRPAQGGHQHLPGRRPAPPGHVGDQDRSPARDPRRVQARSPPTSPASRSAKSSRASPRIMDKCVVIRSVVGADDRHDADPVPDRLAARLAAPHGRPAQHRRRASPSCRGRSIRRCRRSSAWPRRRSTCPGPTPARPASSGPAYAPFKPDGDGLANMTLNGITIDQLRTTASTLLRSFDSLRRDIDTSGTVEGMDAVTAAGPRRADLEQAARRPRPVARSRQASASATATASPTSSSSTAPRRSTISS